MHFHEIFRDEVLGEVLGAVGGAMLAAGAAETDLQVREAALEEALHMRIDQGIDMVQEAEDLAVLLQEPDDGFIQAGQLLEPLVLPRIMHAPAVEHIPSPIPGRILGNSLSEGKTVYRHGQGRPFSGGSVISRTLRNRRLLRPSHSPVPGLRAPRRVGIRGPRKSADFWGGSAEGGHRFPDVHPALTHISSTRIRKSLEDGKVEEAAEMLGYGYSLKGVVVAGNRLGRTIGFPTANMKLYEPLKLVPGRGVYVVEAEVLGKKYRGMTNIGLRPTVGGSFTTIETHILDFDEDIYGLPLRITFLRRLRDEVHFPSLEALKDQLEKDRDCCREQK